MSREEVERRVREDSPKFVEKFSEDARLFCTQVSKRGRGGRKGSGEGVDVTLL